MPITFVHMRKRKKWSLAWPLATRQRSSIAGQTTGSCWFSLLVALEASETRETSHSMWDRLSISGLCSLCQSSLSQVPPILPLHHKSHVHQNDTSHRACLGWSNTALGIHHKPKLLEAGTPRSRGWVYHSVYSLIVGWFYFNRCQMCCLKGKLWARRWLSG